MWLIGKISPGAWCLELGPGSRPEAQVEELPGRLASREMGAGDAPTWLTNSVRLLERGSGDGGDRALRDRACSGAER